MTVKPSTNARRALLGTILAGTTILSTGCSSGGFPLASMNPFSTSAPSSPGAPKGISESIASTAGGAKNQLSTLGTTAKSAWGKTTGAVAGAFGGNKDSVDPANSAPDPLRLDNKPASISPEVFVANGQLWESTGDYKKAMESYVKALQQEPENPPALTSIARLHFRQGEHKKAAEFFQKAIQKSPEDAGLYNDLGLTLSKLGQHQLAAQSLQRALQLAPGTSRYANNLASVKFDSGDSASAYQVLSTNNKPAVAHFNMAYLHFKKGQINEARGHLGQAMQFEPQAAQDAAIKRAVDRSRDMLAQIDGNISPIAQAGPQTAIAGLPKTASIQQASQSQTPGASPHVAPASQVGPATKQTAAKPITWNMSAPMTSAAPTATTPTPTATPPANTLPASTPTVTPGTPAVTLPGTTALPASPTTPAASLPAPTATTPASTAPASTAPATTTPSSTQTPSIPFSLPTGFGTPESK